MGPPVQGDSDLPKSLTLLRDVNEADLSAFFEHQRDPIANRLAAFTARDRSAFMTHWRKILDDETVAKRTILFGDQVAGYVVCFEQAGRRLVGYWLGRDFWGKGIATRALSEFLVQVKERPLYAFVSTGNIGSIRVLEKCGFECSGEEEAPASAGQGSSEVIEEFVFTLAQ